MDGTEDKKKKEHAPAGAQPEQPSVDQMSFQEYLAALDKAGEDDGQQQVDPAQEHTRSLWDRLRNGIADPNASFGERTLTRAKELGRSALRGVAGFADATTDTAGDVANLLTQNPNTVGGGGLVGEAMKIGQKGLRKVVPDKHVIDTAFGKQSDDIVASFAESVTQFATGMAFTGGLGSAAEQGIARLGGGKLLQHIAASAVRGAAVDAVAFDPRQDGLAEFAAKAPPGVRGAFMHEVGEALSVHEDDSQMYARLKRAAGGMIPGIVLDAVVQGIKFNKASRVLGSETATVAEKLKAAETLGKTKEVLTDIATGLHTPEDAHVVVRPTPDGSWEIRPIGEDIPDAKPPIPRATEKEPLSRKIAKALDPKAYEERRIAQEAIHTDELTGLANKRAFESAKARVEGDPKSAIVRFDVNGFKSVNDVLPGKHADGDKVLVSIAGKIKEAAAHYGVSERSVFRVSGDEFAVIAPVEKAAQIRALAERGYGVVEHGNGVKSSVSGGVGLTDVEADNAAKIRKDIHKSEQGILDSRTGQPVQHPGVTPSEPVVERPTFASRGEAEAQAATINNAMDAHLKAARQVGGLAPEQADEVRSVFKRMLEAPTEDDLQKLVEGTHFNFAQYAAEPDKTLAVVEAMSEVFQEQLDKGTSRMSKEATLRAASAAIRGVPQNQLAPAFVNAIRKGGMTRGFHAKLLAADFVMRDLGQQIANMSDLLEARPHDAIAHEEFRRAVTNHLALQQAVSEGWSEAGRTLHAAQYRDEFANASREAGTKGKTTAPAKTQGKGPLDELTAALNKEDAKLGGARPELAGTKVVDAQGKPLVVYHGTTKNFDTFRVGHAPGWGEGIYFTDNAKQAAEEFGHGDGGRVVSAYVDLKNPYRGEPLSDKVLESTAAWKKVESRWASPADAWQEDSKFVGEALRELGYDGVMVDGSNNIDGLEIVAFDPAQVKPVTAPKTKPEVDPVTKFRQEQTAAINEQVQGSNQKLRDPKAPVQDLGIEKSTEAVLPAEGRAGGGPVVPEQSNRSGQLAQTAKEDQVPTTGLQYIAGMQNRELRAVGRMYKMAKGEPRSALAISDAIKIIHDTGNVAKAGEFFVNSLLSGFGTPIVNAVSGAFMSQFNAASRILGGAATGNKALTREGLDIMWANMAYFADNVKSAATAFREGRSIINPVPQTHALGGITGKVIRTPARVLTAIDEFTRVTNYRSYIRAKSLRYWRAAGVEGDALERAVAEDLSQAFDRQTGIAVVPEALKYAEGPTLSGPLGSDTFGGKFHKFVSETPEARFVAPFVKVTTNVFRYAQESTPLLNLANKQARDILLRGGEEAAAIHARSAMATAMYAAAWYMGKSDRLTGGGPTDQSLRALWLQTHKPYSVKVDGEWYSYRRMEPFATFFGIMADVQTISHEGFDTDSYDLATSVIAAVSHNLAAKTYMVGLADFMDAFVNGDRHDVRQYLGRMAGSLAVPQMFAQFNGDDYLREVRGYGDMLMARVPGWSENLPARYNYLGEPILNDPGLTNRMLNPFRDRGPAKKDTVSDALFNLNKGFQPASRRVADGTLDLASKEFGLKDGKTPWDRFQEILREGKHGGKGLRERLAHLVESNKWQRAKEGSEEFPGGERWLMAAAEINGRRQEALAQVRREYPALNDALKLHEKTKGASLRDGQAGVDRLRALAQQR